MKENIIINTTDECEKFIIKEMEEYKRNIPNILIYDVDMDNDLNALNLNLFDERKSEKQFKKDTLEYIKRHCSLDDEAFIKNLIDRIMNRFKPTIKITEDDYLSWEYDDFINQLISNYIIHDYHLDEVLESTDLYVNLYPYQLGNCNSDGEELQKAIDVLIKLYCDDGYNPYYKFEDDENLKELLENNESIEELLDKNLFLNKLFTSQGYEFKDLGDKEKVNKSQFLTTFLSEIKNNDFTGHTFFTFLVKITGKNYLDHLEDENKMIVLKPNNSLKCGLFDPIHSSSSLLEVVLEKTFEISLDYLNIAFQIEDRDIDLNFGCYTPKYHLKNSVLPKEDWYTDFYFKFDYEILNEKYERFKIKCLYDSGYTMADLFRVLDKMYKAEVENNRYLPSEVLHDFEVNYEFDDIHLSFQDWLDYTYGKKVSSEKREKYKMQWLCEEGYQMAKIFKELDKTYNSKVEDSDNKYAPSEVLHDFELDCAFDENLYPSFEEWADNEFGVEYYLL